MRTTRAQWVDAALWGLAAVCGAIALAMFFGSVTTASVGGGATRPTLRCGSVASPGPDYNSEGGACVGAFEQRQMEGGALVVGCVVFAGMGIEHAVRRRRAGRKLP